MQPQKQNHNPKNFITNSHQLQHFQCIICTQKTLNMMRCKTCKKCLCNQCAIDQKTKNNKCPLRCSNGVLQLELIPEYLPVFRCPFSKDCDVVIKSVKEFHQHSRRCGFISQGQREQETKKWNFTCSKNHPLSIKIGTYEQLIKRQKCNTCQEHGIMRVQCKKCDEFYCNYCRPFPIYKSKCPGGHELVRRDVRTLSYRCDVCEISPAMLNIDLDDDFICNLGICGICFKNWPEFQKKVGYIVNQRNYCEVVGDTSITETLSQKQLQQLKQCHFLQILPKQVPETCSWCLKQKPCYKHCKKCNKYYCFSCKRLKIYQNGTCEFDHKIFVMNLEEAELEEKLAQSKVCYACNADLDLKEVRFRGFYRDSGQCGVVFCRMCYVDATQYNFDVDYKYVSFGVRSCFDESTHPLFYLPFGRAFQARCYICKQIKTIKFNCSMCQIPKLYCCNCVPSSDLKKCYCGRVLAGTKKINSICLLCQNMKQVQTCGPCGYSICDECMGEKKDMNHNQEKQEHKEQPEGEKAQAQGNGELGNGDENGEVPD